MNDVTVLMSTYNGEKYLRTQLDSILQQTNVRVELVIRDDGSSDSTLAILEEYSTKYPNVRFYTGKNLGPARSFLDLMHQAPKSSYYAFADQDDYWLPDKLDKAVSKINQCNVADKPVLYYGRPRLVDAELNSLNQQMGISFVRTFQEAVIASQAPGCTMVFNYILLKKVILHPNISFLHMHDDWLHKVCLIYHGILLFDKDVHILYRQHASNAVGGQSTALQSILQHITSFRDKKCVRSRTVKALFDCYKDDMDSEIYDLCRCFYNYQNNLIFRFKTAYSVNIHSSSWKRELACRGAILLGIY